MIFLWRTGADRFVLLSQRVEFLFFLGQSCFCVCLKGLWSVWSGDSKKVSDFFWWVNCYRKHLVSLPAPKFWCSKRLAISRAAVPEERHHFWPTGHGLRQSHLCIDLCVWAWKPKKNTRCEGVNVFPPLRGRQLHGKTGKSPSTKFGTSLNQNGGFHLCLLTRWYQKCKNALVKPCD